MSQPYVGEVRIFGGNWAPSGWAFCNGQLLSIAENDTLFYLIGTTYGGDGETTFALPDLKCRIPLSYGTGSGVDWQLGEMGGQETVTLLGAQLPVHSHPVLASSSPATSTSPAGRVWGTWADSPYSSAAPNANLDPGGVSHAGNFQPHENRAPALGLSFIISLYGIFPSPS
jgi:microcystin-dependent protein